MAQVNPTTVSLTGTGTVGQLEAGWTVSEQATPDTIGTSDGDAGSASLKVVRRSDSEFIGGNAFGLTNDHLGTFNGRVGTPTLSGQTVDVTAYGEMAKLAVPVTAKPFMDGTELFGWTFPLGTILDFTVDAAGNYFIYSSNPQQITKWSPTGVMLATIAVQGNSNGQAGSAGTGVGAITLDPTGAYLYFYRNDLSHVQKITIAGAYVLSFGGSGVGTGAFGSRGGAIACDSTGNVFVTDPDNNRIQKFTSAGAFVATVGSAGSGNGQFATFNLRDIAIDESDQVWALDGGANYRVQCFDNTLTYVSKFSLPVFNTAGIAVRGGFVFVQFTINGVGVIYKYTTAGVLVTSWFGGDAASRVLTAALGNLYYWNPVTQRVSVTRQSALLSDAFNYYMRLADPNGVVAWNASTNPSVAFPGWTGTVWQRLKECAAAFGVEFGAVGTVLSVRDIGSVVLTIAGNGIITTVPTTQGGSQSINVVNQNCTSGALAMYTADQVFKIDTLQFKPVTLQTTNHPLALIQPTATDTLPAPLGTYYVTDALGAHVPATSWNYFGGSVSASIGAVPGQMKLGIQGPRGVIPGFTAPYVLASGIGTLQVPQFSVQGTGVTTKPTVLNLLTGANQAIVTQPTGPTIDIPFITDITRLRTAASWATSKATGVSAQIEFDMDIQQMLGFGIDKGSLVKNSNNIFRITSITYGAKVAHCIGNRHVTRADFAAMFPVTLLNTNYVQNPGAEGATSSLMNVTGATVTTSTDVGTGWPAVGSKSYKIVASSTALAVGGGIVAERAPASPGQRWHARAKVRGTIGGSGPRDYQILITFRNGAGSIVANTGSTVTVAAGTIQDMVWTDIAPAGTATAEIWLARLAGGGAAAADVMYADQLMLTQDNAVSTPAFFYGDTTSAGGLFYGWTGPKDASTSTKRTGTTRGQVKALWAGFLRGDTKIKPLLFHNP